MAQTHTTKGRTSLFKNKEKNTAQEQAKQTQKDTNKQARPQTHTKQS